MAVKTSTRMADRPARSRHRLLLLLAVLLVGGARDGVPQQPGGERLQSARNSLNKAYGLDLVSKPEFPVKLESGLIEGAPASTSDNESYLAILLTEWNLYPPELIRKVGLKRIVLCERLSFGGQLRTAVPDFGNGDLYLDSVRGRHDAGYVRRVIHHEFFHMIDYRDDGALYRDPAWGALNAEGFKYGSGGKNAQGDSNSGVARSDLRGFLNTYSTTGVEEDKAEVFAFLVVDPVYFGARVKEDPVLRSKGEAMKRLLRAFCPAMDAAFWGRVDALRKGQTAAANSGRADRGGAWRRWESPEGP